MNHIISWLKKQKIRIVTGFLVWLPFVVGLIFVDHASAQTLIAEASGASGFQELVKQTQFSFEKAFQETNQVISDLPQQLERVTTEPQSAVRKQIEDDLENRQDSLENLADSIDDLAEEVESSNENLSSSDAQFQKNALNIQQSLENVAKTIDSLADDVENAKENSTSAFRTQIGQKIEAVNQALDGANSAFETINQNPV